MKKTTLIVVALIIIIVLAFVVLGISQKLSPNDQHQSDIIAPIKIATSTPIEVTPIAPTSTTPITQTKATPMAVRAATPTETASMVSANNQFGYDLYARYRTTQTGKNIFYSPFSITTALGMTYEGAVGKTATEMQKVLHLSSNTDGRRMATAGIINDLNKGSASFTLRTANALWAEKTFTFLQTFLSVAENYYKGATINMDFVGNPEGSRQTINSWVADQTNNKILNLIPAGAINNLTRLVLTNAIYFKGTWVVPFDKLNTKPADFTLASGNKISAPTMSQTGEKSYFKYMENKTEQALELPYKGERLSMLIILPKASNLQTVESSLSISSIAALKKSMGYDQVNIFLPKFTFKTTYGMATDLKALGMPTAFTAAADFSGMDGNKDLMISDVIHQAFVDVNEEGTEAAAATAVIIGVTSVAPRMTPIPEFRANHPFIFMIEDNTTGEILFMGKVMDPTAK